MFANSKAYCPHRNCNKCPTQRRFCSSSTFFCLCPNLELGVRDNWWFPHIQSFQPKQAEIWRCDVKAHRLERLRHHPPLWSRQCVWWDVSRCLGQGKISSLFTHSQPQFDQAYSLTTTTWPNSPTSQPLLDQWLCVYSDHNLPEKQSLAICNLLFV